MSHYGHVVFNLVRHHVHITTLACELRPGKDG